MSSLAVLNYPPLNPIAFHIGPLAVHWYGLAYLTGFVVSYLLLRRMVLRGELRVRLDHLADLVSWLAVGVVAGGRTGWWLFYHRPPGYPEPWYEPFAIWHGGMSFHGGLLGVGIALALWTWRYRAPFLNLSDALALVTPIGLFFGRIANFVNAELVGRPADVPWAMIFPGDTIPRHPSQLYEAGLEGLLMLGILWSTRRLLRRWEGATAALFLVLYGIFRFAVEFTREPDPQLGYIAFGWLTMGQLLSLALTVAGIAFGIYVILREQPQSPSPVSPADPDHAPPDAGPHAPIPHQP